MNQTSYWGRCKMAAIIAISFAGMACIDHYTHHELVLSAVYLVPVCLSAWYFSREAVLFMAPHCEYASHSKAA